MYARDDTFHQPCTQVPLSDRLVFRACEEDLNASGWVGVQLEAIDSIGVCIGRGAFRLQWRESVRGAEESVLKVDMRSVETFIVRLGDRTRTE